MEGWKAVLIAFGGNAVLIAVLAFLAKILISEWLKRSTIEKQIVFSKLHEKRTESIAEIYRAINKYIDSCKGFLSSAQNAEEDELNELLNQVSEAANSFRSVFKNNKLYLSKSISEKIEAAFNNSQVPSHNYIFSLGSYKNDHISKEEYESDLRKAYESFYYNEIPKILADLEAEFRGLLGSEGGS